MAQTDVFVVGALHLDVVVDAPHLPALDETVRGERVAYRFGGKGGNQAVAAARFGARAAMAGRVGSDGFTDPVLTALDRAGVDRSQVSQGPGATGMSVAIVDASGEYGAVIVSGENLNIASQDVVVPEKTKALLLQNEVPEEVNLAVLDSVPTETRVILNAAPARATRAAAIDRVDVLVVNRVEAAMMPQPLPPRLTTIVTQGPDGLTLTEPGKAPQHMAGHPVDVASTHGAGDAFCGALAAEIARGAALREAAAFAQAAAALTVSTPPGDRDGLSRAAVERFLARL